MTGRARAIRAAASQFEIHGEVSEHRAHGNGHINDTYLVECRGRGRARALHPAAHQSQRLPQSRRGDAEYRARDGASGCRAGRRASRTAARRVLTAGSGAGRAQLARGCGGETWRAYRFIDNARTYEAVDVCRAGVSGGPRVRPLPAAACQPARAAPARDHPRFSPHAQALCRAGAGNRRGRERPRRSWPSRRSSLPCARQPIAGVLFEANLPERITHNDTKFNNVMLDDATGEAVCVIDLDTVMPGLALYDFGDMVRTTTSPAQEDEQDLSKVTMQFPMFEALVRGYLEAAGGFLTAAEKKLSGLLGQAHHLRDRHPISCRLSGRRHLLQGASRRAQPRPLPHAIQAGGVHRTAGRENEPAGRVDCGMKGHVLRRPRVCGSFGRQPAHNKLLKQVLHRTFGGADERMSQRSVPRRCGLLAG